MGRTAEQELELAKENFLARNEKAAEKHARTARAKSKKASATWREASFMLWVRFFRQKRFSEAKRVLDEFTRICARTGYTPSLNQRLQINMALGCIHRQLGENRIAAEYLVAVQEISQETLSQPFTWECATILAITYRDLGEFDNAIAILEKALPNLEAASEKCPYDAIVSARIMVELYEQKGDVEGGQRWKKAFYRNQVERVANATVYQPKFLEEPVDWGTDDLSYFLNLSHNNTVAMFATERHKFDEVKLINAEYCVARGGLQEFVINIIRDRYPNTKLENVSLKKHDVLGLFLFMRSHSAFLAAARNVLSGQTVDSYANMRVSLESALYAFRCHEKESYGDLYLSRETDPSRSNKTDIGLTFSARKIAASIRLAGCDAVATQVESIYEDLIDKGAHPNIDAFAKSFSHEYSKEQSALIFSTAYLNPDQIAVCLKDLIDAGRCALDVFKAMYPDWIW